jgi:serine-type D-Ala-D-Ala carboxypeptidase
VPLPLAAALLGAAQILAATPPPPSVSPDTLIRAAPAGAGFDPSLTQRLDSIVGSAIEAGVAPGAALAVGRYGRLVHLRGYGRTDRSPDAPAADERTLWDLASLTKVVATTTAAMLLEEEGLLDLDRRVAGHLPGLWAPEKTGITLRSLLVHRAGLEAFAPLWREVRGRDAYLERIDARPLASAPGTRTEYSDWDLILLQLVIESLAGAPLDRFAADRLWRPLGMEDTGFAPDPALRPRIAPTEVQEWRGGLVHGEVHDENAWAMGGVAGHAGLFSSARDLAVFAQMLLGGGSYGGARILRPQSVARWTARQDRGSSRALGWDTPSPGSSAGRYFSPRAFGHTGFTGTSLWVDPHRDLFVVLLTNRVNPTREGTGIAALRRAVADAVQEAIRDAPLVDWEARARDEPSPGDDSPP